MRTKQSKHRLGKANSPAGIRRRRDICECRWNFLAACSTEPLSGLDDNLKAWVVCRLAVRIDSV